MYFVEQEKVWEIERLLAAGGLSQRAIALTVGVARSTVADIAKNKRDARRAAKPKYMRSAYEEPFVHCKGCGGTTQMPCRLCATREEKAAERAKQREIYQLLRWHGVGTAEASRLAFGDNRDASPSSRAGRSARLAVNGA